MARPLRLEFAGALYHLTARGNARARIFADDDDRRCFLELLGKEVAQQGWQLYAYCLMDNHYHLLVETPEPNLAAGMRRFNGVYTQAFNRRHGRVGHVFQGRYKSILVDKDSYGLELCRYLVLNPVRAKMVRRAENWAWSSYGATAGRMAPPDWLDVNWILDQLGGRNRANAYASFVQEGLDQESPWTNLKGQIWLGDEAFLKQMERRLQGKRLVDVPRAHALPARPTATAVTQAVLSVYRIKDEKALCSRMHQESFQAWLYLLRRVANLPLREVARRGKVSQSRVSKIQRAMETRTLSAAMQELWNRCKVKN